MSNKASCIQHPARAVIILIREEYVAICSGDHCSAALLAYFEHWTNSKLDGVEQHAVESEIALKEGVTLPPADTWVYASVEQIAYDLLGLYAEKKIRNALNELVAIGFLSRRANPKYKWDRTTQYLLEVEYVQVAVGEMDTLHSAKRPNQSGEKTESKRRKDRINHVQKTEALPKIHTETPTETQKEKLPYPHTDLIKAWLDTQNAVKPNAYKRQDYHTIAKTLTERGITPADVAGYLYFKKRDPFYSTKFIPFEKVGEEVADWKRRQVPIITAAAPAADEPEDLTPEEQAERDALFDSVFKRTD